MCCFFSCSNYAVDITVLLDKIFRVHNRHIDNRQGPNTCWHCFRALKPQLTQKVFLPFLLLRTMSSFQLYTALHTLYFLDLTTRFWEFSSWFVVVFAVASLFSCTTRFGRFSSCFAIGFAVAHSISCSFPDDILLTSFILVVPFFWSDLPGASFCFAVGFTVEVELRSVK